MPYKDPERRRAFHAEYYQQNADVMKARAAQNHTDNRERNISAMRVKRKNMTPEQKEAQRVRCRQWQRDNPAAARASLVKWKFGLDAAAAAALYETQNNRCAICGCTEAENGKYFAVDHDHATGAVRGLLCSQCNSGLGYFRDSPVNLSTAISYLQKATAL